MNTTNTDNTGEMADITPIKYGLDDTFQFRCHPGVACYTSCCRGINIILTPYDIIRMKNRLELSSEDFLAIYTVPEMLAKTDLPVVTLKLMEDELRSCPFVRDEGCLIYQDRPTTCRYYPLGVASLSHKDKDDTGDNSDGFFFFVNEPHCRGFEEKKQWTVEAWRRDQGVDLHDEINAEWTDLVVRKRSFPGNIMLTEEAKKMFFMASYDIDRFRRFVFDTSFLKRYSVDENIVRKIQQDETALLKFAFQWLKAILFQKGAFKPEL